MATRDVFTGLEVKVLVLQPAADGQPLTIPDAHFLFTADFERSGNDLVMSNESGQTIIVEGYFAGESPVDLASPEGALLRASVVESLAGPLAPGHYAQAGAPDGKTPIGQVETLEGTATAQRTDGTTVQLKIGDPVFQGDVVATSGASKIGITFIDKTVFTLSEDARMVLDELVYSPGGTDNSMLVNLVQGTFVFIAGEVAPTGDMKVQTPVATMGIRGTTVISKVSAIDGSLTTSLDIDPDGEKGSYQIIDTVTNEVLATVTQSGENWIITPSGVPGGPPTVTTLPKNDAELSLDQEALAFIYQTYNAARARFGTDSNNNDGNNNGDGSSNGGSTSSGIESDVDGTETEPLDQNGAPPGSEDGNPTGGPEEPAAPPEGLPEGSNDQSQAPPQPPSSDGVLVVTDEDTPSEGIDIPVSPNNPNDTIFIAITELPPKGLLLFNGEPVEQNELIPAESTEDLTFSPNGEFEELNSTDVEPLQFIYTVSDQNGLTSDPVVGVISVPGVNDAPVAEDDVVSAPGTGGGTEGPAEPGTENDILLIDVLANDTDPDRDDDPTNFSLTEANIESETGGTVDIVGNQVQFDPGTDFDYLNAGDSAEVEVSYTMTDDEGAPSTASVFITVTGENDAPVAVDDTDTGTENQVLTIDVLGNDTDVDDNPTNFTLIDASVVSETGGTVNIVGNQIEFDPGTDFDYLPTGDSQEVEVEYTMEDDAGEPSTASVFITVTGQNDAPTAEDDTGTTNENQVLTLNVLANDTDDDDNDTPANFTLFAASIVSATGGAVEIVGNQLQFNPGTNFDYLNVNDSVEVEVEYTVQDDEGLSSTGTAIITVTGQNDAPVALAGTLETTTDTPASGQLTVFDPDDNETATFALGPNGPQHGTVEIQPDGAFTYTPSPVADAPPFQGFDTFEFTVTDGAGETSTGTVTVEVANESFESEGGQTISFGLNGESPLTSSNPALNGIGIGNLEVNLTEVSGTEINVSFVFDASGSLGLTDYNTQLDAIQKAVDDVRAQFEDSQTVVNFQFVRFASVVTTAEYVFDPNIDPQNDTQTFDIDDIKGELPFTGGGTNFDAGLAAAQSFFTNNSGADQSFLFFSSDGNPSNFSNPPQWVVTAGALNAAGIIISAFGIGPFISPANLDIIDNTGGSENVATVNDLSEAFSGTPIFAAELVSLSLHLFADGVNQGEIATEADLTPDGINSDLLLANIPSIGDLLGEENQFTATATFDFDNDLGTTDDQITLVSLETISASDTAVTKTGTSGDDLLLGGVQADDIDGAGGADVILGFAGDDRLTVSDGTFQKVDGGLGQDTLVLDDTDLDFTALASGQISSIETIDLNDTGASTIFLDFDSVMNLSETVNDELDAILESLLGVGNAPDHSLVIDGTGADAVDLADSAAGTWFELSDTAFAGYDIYGFQDSGGTLLAAVAIDDDVQTPPPTA